jgi:hypothetical protein
MAKKQLQAGLCAKLANHVTQQHHKHRKSPEKYPNSLAVIV